MQEDIENRSIVLTTRAAKMTAQVLAKLMHAALRKMKQHGGDLKPGRRTLRQLTKDGPLSSMPINDDNIKAFDPVARKYGVSYELKKDASTNPPQWLVFFRAKDADAMHGAFTEFHAKMIDRASDKPSARGEMQEYRNQMKNVVRNKTRHKHREGPEL